MIALHLFRENERILSLLSDKKMIRLGRGDGCEITLPDPTLSRVHCTLSLKDSGWLLEDQSKNGLYQEGFCDRLPERLRLEDKKRYRLGHLYSFEVELRPTTKSTEDKTLLLGSRPTQLLGFDPASGKVLLGKASLNERPIEAEGLTIGSHSGNDIVLTSEGVSQFHARIDYSGGAFVLSDLGSTNGTEVGGIRVSKVSLKEDAIIQIGAHLLEFRVEKTEILVEPKSSDTFMDMVSRNKQMKRIFSMVEAVSPTDAPVYIHGETGTGKELLARAVHDLSRRYQGPFLALNCAALARDVVESELFGHEKGAFTGAMQSRIGAFEAAHGGTLFLDEIAELDMQVQAKILRVLESGEIKRVGSNQTISSHVRIVAATHRDLEKEVREGRFREDLFYRLHVMPIAILPLRDRIEDLPLLVHHFLTKMKVGFDIDEDSLSTLATYKFPGNVRELRNILQRACVEYEILGGGAREKRVLRPKHFHFVKGMSFVRKPDTQEALEERDRLKSLLIRYRFNQSDVARALGIATSTLHDRVKRYGLTKQEIEAAELKADVG